MRKLFFLTLATVCIAGCATGSTLPAYGNFTQSTVPAYDKAMAEDVAHKLALLYPPARSRFRLGQAAPDPFGSALIAALRTKGYAIAEFYSAAKAKAPSGSAPGAADQPSDLALAYLVDQPLEPGLYRVTVHVNSQSLSRLYRSGNGTASAAGYWIRKE